jgi:hypothetical protein
MQHLVHHLFKGHKTASPGLPGCLTLWLSVLLQAVIKIDRKTSRSQG